MSVKKKLILFKYLLYVKEIVEAGSITEAAENNGIKSSNLSKVIQDAENLFGRSLFSRAAHGMIPSVDALEMVRVARKMDDCLNEVTTSFKNVGKIVKLYVAPGILIKNLSDFQGVFIETLEENEADVIVSNIKPLASDQLISTENRVGKDVVQSVWVCAKNSSQAILLARFIILQIHHQ